MKIIHALFATILMTGLSFDAFAQADRIGGRWIMQNHFSEVVTDQHFKGKFRLIFFGYTFCPDVCPTSLSNVAEAMDLLEDMDEEFQPLFVSVDPKRDTPQVLREYVSNFHPKLIGLTGTKAAIDRITDRFKVSYSVVKDDKNDEEYYLIDHSAGLYFMSETGIFIRKFAHGISGEEIANRIKDILKNGQ
ncbi:SCO family protein [Terasakiella sp. A23]|uniref:SCO family protein n=1 Tax=Terasakiella sp. FCG-A23 TaxID=3080561 RepID=UPI0029532453|nr:SCO family protein [Terasakiella sp. A23]MDV7341072.1 SCO family protein [Terasakiella sp. A23]